MIVVYHTVHRIANPMPKKPLYHGNKNETIESNESAFPIKTGSCRQKTKTMNGGLYERTTLHHPLKRRHERAG